MFPFPSYCEVFCRNLTLPGAQGCKARFEKAFLTQYTHTSFFSGNLKKKGGGLQNPSFMQTLKKAGFLPLRITITRQIPFQVRAGGRGKAWGLPPKPGICFK